MPEKKKKKKTGHAERWYVASYWGIFKHIIFFLLYELTLQCTTHFAGEEILLYGGHIGDFFFQSEDTVLNQEVSSPLSSLRTRLAIQYLPVFLPTFLFPLLEIYLPHSRTPSHPSLIPSWTHSLHHIWASPHHPESLLGTPVSHLALYRTQQIYPTSNTLQFYPQELTIYLQELLFVSNTQIQMVWLQCCLNTLFLYLHPHNEGGVKFAELSPYSSGLRLGASSPGTVQDATTHTRTLRTPALTVWIVLQKTVTEYSTR